MKSYRWFLSIFAILLVVYIIAEIYRPQPINWMVTLNKDDKNPYGSYVLHQRLKDIFPAASLKTLREPPYNVLHNKKLKNTVYVIIAPTYSGGKPDVTELLRFAREGGHVFLAANIAPSAMALMDTLGLKSRNQLDFVADSTSVNLVNPALKARTDYGFKKYTIDNYFSVMRKPDSTTILGINHKDQANFVRVKIGKGAIFVHAAPLCFSNYFMLYNNNHEYLSKVFSYLPAGTSTVYWDEYYKLGRTGAETPLRFFLSNTWLTWALRLTIITLILYVLVEMKRRQRVIPVIGKLRNTTLDFVKTVAGVYLSQKDNKSIANNKVQYWLQYIRKRYYLQTNQLDDAFVTLLSKRSGVGEDNIRTIVEYILELQSAHSVSEELLVRLNHQIDQFYTTSKT